MNYKQTNQKTHNQYRFTQAMKSRRQGWEDLRRTDPEMYAYLKGNKS